MEFRIKPIEPFGLLLEPHRPDDDLRDLEIGIYRLADSAKLVFALEAAEEVLKAIVGHAWQGPCVRGDAGNVLT